MEEPYTTYGNFKLDLNYEDDEVRRGHNEVKRERVEDHASPSLWSLELDSPVYAKYQAIETYESQSVHLSFEPNVIRVYLP